MPDLILWITMMGTLASFNAPTLEAAFLQILQETAMEEQYRSWNDVQGRLERYLWVSEVNGVDGREIWTKVQSMNEWAERPDPQFW
jgi:hypothetical protein